MAHSGVSYGSTAGTWSPRSLMAAWPHQSPLGHIQGVQLACVQMRVTRTESERPVGPPGQRRSTPTPPTTENADPHHIRPWLPSTCADVDVLVLPHRWGQRMVVSEWCFVWSDGGCRLRWSHCSCARLLRCYLPLRRCPCNTKDPPVRSMWRGHPLLRTHEIHITAGHTPEGAPPRLADRHAAHTAPPAPPPLYPRDPAEGPGCLRNIPSSAACRGAGR